MIRGVPEVLCPVARPTGHRADIPARRSRRQPHSGLPRHEWPPPTTFPSPHSPEGNRSITLTLLQVAPNLGSPAMLQQNIWGETPEPVSETRHNATPVDFGVRYILQKRTNLRW